MDSGKRLRGPSNGDLPAYFYRLSQAAQSAFLKSDAIERIDLSPTPQALRLTAALIAALGGSNPRATTRAAQALSDELCRSLGLRAPAVTVDTVRPRNARGELHGIFYPSARPRIVLWMRTAARHDVVKPRMFLRTLMHELGHYFDYALLGLGESFHTSGFFKRESSLMNALAGALAEGDTRIASRPSSERRQR